MRNSADHRKQAVLSVLAGTAFLAAAMLVGGWNKHAALLVVTAVLWYIVGLLQFRKAGPAATGSFE